MTNVFQACIEILKLTHCVKSKLKNFRELVFSSFLSYGVLSVRS